MAFSKARRLGELVTTAGVLDQATVATASSGDNDTSPASTAFVTGAIADLADSAPSTLNTLNELAAALGDDANFSTTVTNSIATKLPLAGGTMTGTIAGFTSTGIDDNADATAITIDSSERVGIGETSPDLKLHVKSSGQIAKLETTASTGDCILTFADAAANKGFVGFGSSSSEIFQITNIENGDMKFDTNNTERMRINSAGYVGIGTTTPTAKLEIAATGTNAAPHIKLAESGDTREFNIYNDGSGNGRLVLADSDDDTPDTEIVLADNGILQFKTANTERFYIGNDGYISVGYGGSVTKFYTLGDAAGEYVGYFQHDGNNADRYGVRIVCGRDDANGVIYHIRCDDGDGHVLGYLQHENGTLSVQQASDERLKENIVDSTLEGINTLKNIRQREFNLKRDTSKTKIIGYVAQEMESVYPASISVMDATQDGSAPEDDPENPYKTLSKTALIDVLIKATQEQQEQIEAMKKEIEELKG